MTLRAEFEGRAPQRVELEMTSRAADQPPVRLEVQGTSMASPAERAPPLQVRGRAVDPGRAELMQDEAPEVAARADAAVQPIHAAER